MFQTEPVSENLGFPEKCPDQILRQVAVDLQAAIDHGSDPKKKLRLISNKTGIHVKTLARLLRLENKPTHLTVFKLYRYLTGAQSQDQVLGLCPEIIRNYLEQGNQYRIEKNLNYETVSENRIQTNEVFAELYILCGAGPVPENTVQQKFGEYGMKIAQDMLEKNYLQKLPNGSFVIGPNQIYLTPKCVKSLGLIAAKNYCKPENAADQNKLFMGFLVEGLTEETYREWLAIDIDAYKKKLELAKKATSLGTKKAFTFQVTDTLETE